MNQQLPLIVDSLNDAIRDTVRALGVKEIARELWPAKGADAAARYLNDCLNPDREQKLSGEEILHIARRGREAGIYTITAFFCAATGFAPPVAIDPEDERAALHREYLKGIQELKRIADRLERAGVR